MNFSNDVNIKNSNYYQKFLKNIYYENNLITKCRIRLIKYE